MNGCARKDTCATAKALAIGSLSYEELAILLPTDGLRVHFQPVRF